MKLSANPQKTPTAAQRGSHKRDMHDSRLRFIGLGNMVLKHVMHESRHQAVTTPVPWPVEGK